MFVRYAFLYHSSDCDETSVSWCAHAREGLWITFLLLNIKTITKSAKFHEIFNEVLAMPAGHLTYDVREYLARGRCYHDNLQITSPCHSRGRCYHDNNHPLSSGCLRGEREGGLQDSRPFPVLLQSETAVPQKYCVQNAARESFPPVGVFHIVQRQFMSDITSGDDCEIAFKVDVP
jgi:hypothetical protein